MAVYLLHALSNGLNLRNWEPYCSYLNSELRDGKLQCTCGENYEIFRWEWEKQATNLHVLLQDNKEVMFHPVYSPGTAAVKGSDALKSNMHHYWEIKILTKLYGTDVMVGVGTSNVLLNIRQFCSMLGYNDQSWGYSYRGVIQHDKLVRKYGSVFGLGSIIGVHLDMCTGTLEYYLNRKSLGVAFRGLKGKDLYPMICSTAAQSSMKLTCSVSLESTLQMKCLVVIKQYPKLSELYHSIPGLSRLIKTEYFWLLPPQPEDKEDKNELTIEDEAVLPSSTIAEINNTTSRQRKRLRTNGWNLHESQADEPDAVPYGDFIRKTTDSSSCNNNDLDIMQGCVVGRSASSTFPLRPTLNVEQGVIGVLDDDMRDALRSITSSIDGICDVPDRKPLPIILKHIDIDALTREMDEGIESYDEMGRWEEAGL